MSITIKIRTTLLTDKEMNATLTQLKNNTIQGFLQNGGN